MDDLIKTATRILAQHWRDPSTNMSLDRQRMLASHVVPVIAAAAIRRAIDAADEAFAQEDIAMTQWGNGYIDGQGAALGFIRNYADEMENDRG